MVYALAYALRGIKAKGRAHTLSEEERYAIARVVVDKLRERGDPWAWIATCPPSFTGHRPRAIGEQCGQNLTFGT